MVPGECPGRQTEFSGKGLGNLKTWACPPKAGKFNFHPTYVKVIEPLSAKTPSGELVTEMNAVS